MKTYSRYIGIGFGFEIGSILRKHDIERKKAVPLQKPSVKLKKKKITDTQENYKQMPKIKVCAFARTRVCVLFI